MTGQDIRTLAADAVAAADLWIEAHEETERLEAAYPRSLGNPKVIAAISNEGAARMLHYETGRDLRAARRNGA